MRYPNVFVITIRLSCSPKDSRIHSSISPKTSLRHFTNWVLKNSLELLYAAALASFTRVSRCPSPIKCMIIRMRLIFSRIGKIGFHIAFVEFVTVSAKIFFSNCRNAYLVYPNSFNALEALTSSPIGTNSIDPLILSNRLCILHNLPRVRPYLSSRIDSIESTSLNSRPTWIVVVLRYCESSHM